MERRTRSRQHRRFVRAFTLVDALMGAAVTSVAVIGFMAICLSLFKMTDNQRSTTICYQLARWNIERQKGYGFAYAKEGTQIWYYDKFGQSEATSAFTGAAYEVDVTIDSGGATTTSSGQTVPTDAALRTVTVVVKSYPARATLLSWGTLFSKGGA